MKKQFSSTDHQGSYLKQIFLIVIIFTLITPLSLADEPSTSPEDRNPSAAAFDKRLPPVIPGEQISDGKDRMNVWSTSGGVSVGQPPRAPDAGQDRYPRQPIGVIVDARPGGDTFRDRDRDHKDRDHKDHHRGRNPGVIINDSRDRN